MREDFLTPGALHLLLLEIETLDETVNLPLVPFQFMEKPLGLFIWKETVQIIIFPWEKDIEVDFPSPLLLGILTLSFLFLFHHFTFFIGYRHLFCQIKPHPLER